MNPVARSLSASLLSLFRSSPSPPPRARRGPPLRRARASSRAWRWVSHWFYPSAPSASTLLPTLATPCAVPGLTAENRPVPLQIDSGTDNVRIITMTFPDGSPLATIYMLNVALGGYETGREYWFVNNGTIAGKLGADALTVSIVDSNTTTPSDPGYSPEQRFSQPQSPTGGWGSGWTTDPISGGDLYAGPNNTYLRLVVSTGSPAVITRVVWYQVLSGGSPANINPAGSWSVGTGSVPVPSGSTGYSIAQITS